MKTYKTALTATLLGALFVAGCAPGVKKAVMAPINYVAKPFKDPVKVQEEPAELAPSPYVRDINGNGISEKLSVKEGYEDYAARSGHYFEIQIFEEGKALLETPLRIYASSINVQENPCVEIYFQQPVDTPKEVFEKATDEIYEKLKSCKNSFALVRNEDNLTYKLIKAQDWNGKLVVEDMNTLAGRIVTVGHLQSKISKSN